MTLALYKLLQQSICLCTIYSLVHDHTEYLLRYTTLRGCMQIELAQVPGVKIDWRTGPGTVRTALSRNLDETTTTRQRQAVDAGALQISSNACIIIVPHMYNVFSHKQLYPVTQTSLQSLFCGTYDPLVQLVREPNLQIECTIQQPTITVYW